MPARMQGVAVGGPEHGTATGGQHQALQAGEFVECVLLGVAERLFAVLCEELADGHPDPALDLVVAVDEPQPELPCQLPPDRGLATSGHADQGELQSGQGAKVTGLTVLTGTATVVPVPLGEVKVTKMTPETTVGSVKL